MTRSGFIVAGDGPDQRRVAVGSSLIVGRSGDNGLVIKDTAASRRHLEILSSGGGYVCRDLNSRNGTIVNGDRTKVWELKDGDRILIGETLLRFELGPEKAPRLPDKTVFLQTVLDPMGREQALPPSSGSKEMLEAAYALMNALASNFNPCDLVDRVLETTTKAIHAHRGAVLFAGPDGKLQPCGVCGRVHTIVNGVPRPANVDEIQISESVARRVLRDGETVHIQSGLTDGSVDPSVSIAALRLTSILCVPIRTHDNVLGILYMDTNITDHEYTTDDRLLAAAAGNSAGLALDNARNHRALLEKQRIEQDIEAAWTIQESFLVSDWPTDDPRFEVFGMTQPAKVVGGDFYDFAYIDSDTIGMLIGDVSGKGVPAALTMAQLLAEFRLNAPGVSSPAELLGRLNDGLVKRSLRGLFCTVAVIAIDLRDGGLMGANAGHHPMMVISPTEVTTTLDASGPPIGILPGISWEDVTMTISPGDTLLFYTDGIVEARASDDGEDSGSELVEYGLEGLERVAEAYHGCEPRELIDAIIRDVHRFCSPLAPHDDCTMIALRYLGHG